MVYNKCEDGGRSSPSRFIGFLGLLGLGAYFLCLNLLVTDDFSGFLRRMCFGFNQFRDGFQKLVELLACHFVRFISPPVSVFGLRHAEARGRGGFGETLGQIGSGYL